MHLEVAPETERLVREEISSGHFRSVDELIKAGVYAWREKNISPDAEAQPHNLVEVCAMVQGLADDLDITRNQSSARPLDLG